MGWFKKPFCVMLRRGKSLPFSVGNFILIFVIFISIFDRISSGRGPVSLGRAVVVVVVFAAAALAVVVLLRGGLVVVGGGGSGFGAWFVTG